MDYDFSFNRVPELILYVIRNETESLQNSSDGFKRVLRHEPVMGIKEMCLAVFQWKPVEVE